MEVINQCDWEDISFGLVLCAVKLLVSSKLIMASRHAENHCKFMDNFFFFLIYGVCPDNAMVTDTKSRVGELSSNLSLVCCAPFFSLMPLGKAWIHLLSQL